MNAIGNQVDGELLVLCPNKDNKLTALIGTRLCLIEVVHLLHIAEQLKAGKGLTLVASLIKGDPNCNISRESATKLKHEIQVGFCLILYFMQISVSNEVGPSKGICDYSNL